MKYGWKKNKFRISQQPVECFYYRPVLCLITEQSHNSQNVRVQYFACQIAELHIDIILSSQPVPLVPAQKKIIGQIKFPFISICFTLSSSLRRLLRAHDQSFNYSTRGSAAARRTHETH